MKSIVYNHGQLTPNHTFSYIDIGSINNINLSLNATETIIEAKDAPSRARRIVKSGDILYSTVRPYLHNMCIVDRVFTAMPIASTGLAVMACHSGLNNSYLFLYLQSPQFDQYANAGDNAKGVAYPAINDEKLYNALIPIPPTNEQEKISDFFNKVLLHLRRFKEYKSQLDTVNKSINDRLKKSILQEAIQGKLVPQNPDDEPASALLQRIKEEKQKLVKEGKLKKKDVVDSIIFKGDDNKYFEKKGKDVVCIDDEIPFEIPASWEWVRLANVVMVNPKNAAPDNSDVAFIPMELIDATYLSSYSFLKRKWRDIKTGFTHFADGDVAFAKITPCFQNRKSMILKDLPNGLGAGTTELKVLRPYRNTISAEYLLFFLESPYFVEEATFKGTANQQRITSGYMETKLFPLPPIKEQVRIAQKVKEAYKQIDLYQVL